MGKPIASLSLDLDNHWSYLKTHGDPGWESFPSYLDVVVPRVLRLLAAHNLTITVFVVGQDAALDKNREPLAALAAAGHEIGNHSFHHEPWLHLYPKGQIESELDRAEAAIEGATGRRPVGFRGPGFSLSRTTVRALTRRQYLYDASTFPTFLGPLARAYYFLTTRLTPEERGRRRALFGTFADGLRPIKPYRWQTDAGSLVEIPVTTMPLLRLPFHVSYVLYLSIVAPALGLGYFRTALRLCRLAGTEPSVLLHPLDFLGCDDVSNLSFFPAMGLPSQRKIAVVSRALRLLSAEFEVVPLQRHARLAAQTLNLPALEPVFSQAEPSS